MSRYNALVNSFQVENLQPGGIRVRLELVGAAGDTPRVYPYDGVRLELRRQAAGQSGPALQPDEPVQVLNATVADVHNEAPADPTVVSITFEGCAPSLTLAQGDSLDAALTRTSAGVNAPATGPEPVQVNA